jgi:hypothetical protein
MLRGDVCSAATYEKAPPLSGGASQGTVPLPSGWAAAAAIFHCISKCRGAPMFQWMGLRRNNDAQDPSETPGCCNRNFRWPIYLSNLSGFKRSQDGQDQRPILFDPR